MEYSPVEASDMEYFQGEVHEERESLLKESQYETQYEEDAIQNESDMGPMDNSEEVVVEEALPIRRLKRRRKAGEISGRQLKKKEVVNGIVHFLPHFIRLLLP